jgi:dihydropteroate synthase
MGVLNVTPDSFYDGGRNEGERAESRLEELVTEGAFVMDIGGESTRPGAQSVSAHEQIERLTPAVKAAIGLARRTRRHWISVDTSDPAVAEVVLDWGAHIINDVSLLANKDLARVVKAKHATLLLMHSRGKMAEMQGFSHYPDDGYADVVTDVMREWSEARDRAIRVGVPAADILFDPGIGFAKNAKQSLEVLRRVSEFSVLGAPIVVGPSRKSFLNAVHECPPEGRLGGTIAACLHAAEQGAMLIRVHDVALVHQALMTRELLAGSARAPATTGQGEGGSCSTAS